MTDRHLGPGWDAQAINSIAEEHYGRLKELFEAHGWPERGSSMMPIQQRRVAEVYGSVANFVRDHEFAALMDPLEAIERDEIARDRVLSPNEMAALAGALNEIEANRPAAVAAIRFLALTGLRVSEALAIKWDHVDLGTGRLLIPDSTVAAADARLSAGRGRFRLVCCSASRLGSRESS